MNAHFKNIRKDAVFTRSGTKEIFEKISQTQHNSKIRYVVLFGSEARGNATITSDVDIAIISDEPLTAAERREFAEPLEAIKFPECRIINTLTADLSTENFMDVNYHIKREGVVIYER